MFKTLHKNDILALKQADHVVISTVYHRMKNNIARITCAKQITPDDFKTWEINCLTNVTFLDDLLISNDLECQHVIPHSCVDWLWQTAVGQLKVGDELEIMWCPDAFSTIETVTCNLYGDMVKWIQYRDTHRFHTTLGMKVATKHQRMIQGGVLLIPSMFDEQET